LGSRAAVDGNQYALVAHGNGAANGVPEAGGDEIADSSAIIRVDEDDRPPRYYFPRADVKIDLLERSDTTTSRTGSLSTTT
ncbi:MAG: DUF427 domain-containing protein, partial [Alphaproteobacteria bacterium]